jgi:mRNA-degrading endonuclease RelE of RelBE toxin-antitoxin system
MFKVFTTREFDKDFEKLDESEKKQVRVIMLQLRERGDNVGKPLGRKYFREKKFGGKRLYFLVYKEFIVALAVGMSDKKAQQAEIDDIIFHIKEYEIFIRRELEKRKD